MDLLIHNTSQIVTVAANGARAKCGGEMNEIHVIENGAVGIENGKIIFVGRSSDVLLSDADQTVHAMGRIVLPGFIDSHTHLVFAGSREDEFVMRNAGATYADIASAGGGINTTVKATRAASRVELLDTALQRLDSVLGFGTTTIEIKSGYGLNYDDEIKILEVIAAIKDLHVVDVVPTFLGAHTIPFDYKDRRDEYINLLIEKLIPEIASKDLARFCDVFCEKNNFSLDESRQILSVAQAHGLKLKLHADQLTPLGGSSLAAKLHATSADHLDHISDDAMQAMKQSGTIATLLPGVSLFLGEKMPPARKLIDAGLPVALATDFNPGSCMSENIQLMMSLGAMQMGMTPEEVITAVTLNGAAALDMSDQIGSIEVGKSADILLFDVPDYKFIPYHFGVNHLTTVIKQGHIVFDKSLAPA